MTRDTWEQLGRPRLYESGIYLKLADQGLIEHIEVWRNVDTTIKGISTKFDFEIIDPKEGSSSFPALVGRPWGRKNESINISRQSKDKTKREWTKIHSTYPSIPRRTLDRTY